MGIQEQIALERIFTMLTAILVVGTFLCVNLINGETTSLFEESTKYPILKPNQYEIEFLELHNESLIDWENGFKKCGNTIEGCPVANVTEVMLQNKTSQNNQNETTAGNSTFLQKPEIDFKEQPALCRCDEKCMKYGDCCSSVLTKMRKIPKDNYWRCVKLLDSRHSVRMISKCPSDYNKDDVNKQLCEIEDSSCPSIDPTSNHASHHCPYMDVPVYNNKTGNLYRSIFCARCHHVSNHDILPMKHEILCSTNFNSSEEWREFIKRSSYQRGRLRWIDPTDSTLQCKLHIKQLQPDVIKETVSDVRFCMTGTKEDCSLDLNTEENLITYSLCFSYTLVVAVKRGPEFLSYKNPHCAKCDDPDLDIRRSPVCHRTAPRDRGMLPNMATRMFAGDTGPGPVGINILFHFSLDMDDGYVGYTSKCEEDEILDFIRHKCVPVICPKGYELLDGQCEKNSVDDTPMDDDNNDTSILIPRDTNSSNSSPFSNSSVPCFLIIFHNGEYRQLENGSLAVNKSGNSGGVVIFEPGEYEIYDGDDNNKSMSICAKDVEQTFESSFAPALSHISNILLVLSVLCLLAHVALYIILPKMRNLPGNNLLCLTSCLLISNFIFLTFISTSNHAICVVASVTMHYFLLSGFVWMYVMSFDIWRTFSSEFLVRRYSGDSKKTFIKYSLFAWLLPLLIVILSVITDFALPESWLTDADFGPVMRKLRPLYGHNNTCWIGQKLSLFVFFAFPVGLIILCNLMLFALSAATIWTQNKEGNRFISGTSPTNSGNKHQSEGNNKIPLQARNSGSTKKSDKIRFKLYAKLALIMGLTWILGLLSGFTQWEWLWYPYVLFNGLQGTFIFVAFDCKPKVWNMVKEECGWKKKKVRKGDVGDTGSSDTATRRTASTMLSSSVHSSPSRKTKGNVYGSADKDLEKTNRGNQNH